MSWPGDLSPDAQHAVATVQVDVRQTETVHVRRTRPRLCLVCTVVNLAMGAIALVIIVSTVLALHPVVGLTDIANRRKPTCTASRCFSKLYIYIYHLSLYRTRSIFVLRCHYSYSFC